MTFCSNLLLAAALALAALAGPALADEDAAEIRFEDVPEFVPEKAGGHWYLRADGGYDGGFLAGAGIGYQFNDWLRGDVTLDAATDRVHSALVTLYADLGTVAGFTPYLGAGAGFAHADWNKAGASDWRASYALSAGIARDLDRNFKLDLAYRFGWIAGDSLAGPAGGDARTQHAFRIGLRYLLK